MAIIFKNKVNDSISPSGAIEITTKDVKGSTASVIRKDGTITKTYPYRLFINSKEITINDDIFNMINKIITQINQE